MRLAAPINANVIKSLPKDDKGEGAPQIVIGAEGNAADATAAF